MGCKGWLLLLGIASVVPGSLAAQQSRPARPATPALRPAISQWETAPTSQLPAAAREARATAAVAGPDLTSETVAIVVLIIVAIVVIVRVTQ